SGLTPAGVRDPFGRCGRFRAPKPLTCYLAAAGRGQTNRSISGSCRSLLPIFTLETEPGVTVLLAGTPPTVLTVPADSLSVVSSNLATVSGSFQVAAFDAAADLGAGSAWFAF